MMSQRANGIFEVKMTPQKPDNAEAEAAAIGRMSLEKKFRGSLEATSIGQMLAFMTGGKGSAGDVAMEKVTGTLDGRSGSFVLQHSGTMNRGAASLALAVVPDSGIGQLAGLAGTMEIKVENGQHH